MKEAVVNSATRGTSCWKCKNTESSSYTWQIKSCSHTKWIPIPFGVKIKCHILRPSEFSIMQINKLLLPTTLWYGVSTISQSFSPLFAMMQVLWGDAVLQPWSWGTTCHLQARSPDVTMRITVLIVAKWRMYPSNCCRFVRWDLLLQGGRYFARQKLVLQAGHEA